MVVCPPETIPRPTQNSEHPPVNDGDNEGPCHEHNQDGEHLYVNWETSHGLESGPKAVSMGPVLPRGGPVQLTVIPPVH